MAGTRRYLAVDLGASSGRVVLGEWDGSRFALSEIHRFANGPVRIHDGLYSDVLWALAGDQRPPGARL